MKPISTYLVHTTIRLRLLEDRKIHIFLTTIQSVAVLLFLEAMIFVLVHNHEYESSIFNLWTVLNTKTFDTTFLFPNVLQVNTNISKDSDTSKNAFCCYFCRFSQAKLRHCNDRSFKPSALSTKQLSTLSDCSINTVCKP